MQNIENLKAYVNKCEQDYLSEINITNKMNKEQIYIRARNHYLSELSKSVSESQKFHYMASSDYGVYGGIQQSACIGSAGSIGLSWGCSGLVAGRY